MSQIQEKGSTTVGKALQVLDYLSQRQGSVGITECARDLGINKATIYRLLFTLEEFGLVAQDAENGRYRLGSRVLSLSHAYWSQIGYNEAVEAELHRLRRDAQETVNLAVLEGGKCVYIYSFEGMHAVRMVSVPPGSTDYAHCTAVGKAMLAYLPKDEVDAVIKRHGLPKRTENTIDDPQLLFHQLQEVRRRGFAVDEEENAPDCRCVAAAMLNEAGRPIGAISIAGPSTRLLRKRDDIWGKMVINAARRLSAAFYNADPTGARLAVRD